MAVELATPPTNEMLLVHEAEVEPHPCYGIGSSQTPIEEEAGRQQRKLVIDSVGRMAVFDITPGCPHPSYCNHYGCDNHCK